MYFTTKSVSLGLVLTAVFSAGSLVGCSSASKNQATAPSAAPAAPAKPAVKETPATVTVHGSDKKAAKAPKAEKADKTAKAEDGAPSSMTAECSATGDDRKIAIKSTPSGGCEVLYTKGGKTTSITSAQHETKKCQETFDKVKGNLEKAGFKCN